VGVFATGGWAGRQAGGVRTLLQPARAQCLRLSGCFFHLYIISTKEVMFSSALISLFVSRITQKLLNRFSQNSM